MSAPVEEDGSFDAAPLMAGVPALVTRPQGFFMPPASGASTIAFGAAPAPGGGALLCISIQHGDGSMLIAAVPEELTAQLAAAMLDATRQMRTRQFAQPGAAQ